MDWNTERIVGRVASTVAVPAIASFWFFVLAGCQQRTPEAAPTVEIRGQPIKHAVTNSMASGLVASNAPVADTAVNTAIQSNVLSLAAEQLQLATNQFLPGGYQLAGFDRLAGYNFEMSDELMAPLTNTVAKGPTAEDQIPKPVKALDQKRVAVRGFMLPLKVQAGRVTEMLIMKDQSMCCYGTVPKINEWVSVKMQGEGVKPVMDQPVTLFGTMRVGEMRENGYLVGIYSLEGEKMTASEDD